MDRQSEHQLLIVKQVHKSLLKVLRAPKPSDLTRKGYCSAILKISTATVWYTFIKQFILVMQLSISTV